MNLAAEGSATSAALVSAEGGPSADRLRVLHIVSGLRVGGAERMLIRVVRGLQPHTDQAVIALVDGPMRARLEAQGIPLLSPRGRGFAGSVRALAGSFRFARRFRPDLVQGWMYHGNLLASALCAAIPGRPPCVWNIRQCLDALAQEKPLTRLTIRVAAMASRRADVIAYNSETGAAQHWDFGFRGRRQQIIPNGYEPEEFEASATARDDLRKRLRLHSQAQVVAYVARYHPLKGHLDFVEAAAVVRAERPDAHFALIGEGTDADGTPLANLIRTRNLEDRVHCLGLVSNPRDLIAGADLLCLGSLSEAFPNVLGEALAVGVACVSTDVGDARRVVGPGGRVVPPRDPLALAAAMTELLALDDRERHEIGLAGREHVRTQFSLERVIGMYSRCYAELLGNRVGSTAGRP